MLRRWHCPTSIIGMDQIPFSPSWKESSIPSWGRHRTYGGWIWMCRVRKGSWLLENRHWSDTPGTNWCHKSLACPSFWCKNNTLSACRCLLAHHAIVQCEVYHLLFEMLAFKTVLFFFHFLFLLLVDLWRNISYCLQCSVESLAGWLKVKNWRWSVC